MLQRIDIKKARNQDFIGRAFPAWDIDAHDRQDGSRRIGRMVFWQGAVIMLGFEKLSPQSTRFLLSRLFTMMRRSMIKIPFTMK